jgi:hypothetical protein
VRHRLLIQVRDAIECVLLPALAALLPWRLAFALLRAASYLPLHGDVVRPAGPRAQAFGLAPDVRAFERRLRLYYLLDHTDLYLARWFGDSWWRRHLKVEGAWPEDGKPFVAVFYHSGNGLFAMRHLAWHTGAANLVGRPLDEDEARRRPIRGWYGRARYAECARSGRAPVIFWGGSKAKIESVLEHGPGGVLGAVDVPPTEIHSLTEVTFLGRPTHFTHGLIRLAQAHRVPIAVFSLGLSPDARERVLRIEPAFRSDQMSLPALMQHLADRADAGLRADPAIWYLWPWVDAFFPAPPTAAPERVESLPASSENEPLR